jgi:hypothetical protein
LDAQGPFSFALTTEGALTVVWGHHTIQGGPQLRMGIVIPPEEVKILRWGLQETRNHSGNAIRKATNARRSLICR